MIFILQRSILVMTEIPCFCRQSGTSKVFQESRSCSQVFSQFNTCLSLKRGRRAYIAEVSTGMYNRVPVCSTGGNGHLLMSTCMFLKYCLLFQVFVFLYLSTSANSLWPCCAPSFSCFPGTCPLLIANRCDP